MSPKPNQMKLKYPASRQTNGSLLAILKVMTSTSTHFIHFYEVRCLALVGIHNPLPSIFFCSFKKNKPKNFKWEKNASVLYTTQPLNMFVFYLVKNSHLNWLQVTWFGFFKQLFCYHSYLYAFTEYSAYFSLRNIWRGILSSCSY